MFTRVPRVLSRSTSCFRSKSIGENKLLGQIGEDLVAEYLQKSGYRILARNWRSWCGELDLVCLQGRELVCIEVKTRKASRAARQVLFDSLTKKKRRKLEILCQQYLRIFTRRFFRPSVRIDVVGVLLDPQTLELLELRHLKAAVSSSE